MLICTQQSIGDCQVKQIEIAGDWMHYGVSQDSTDGWKVVATSESIVISGQKQGTEFRIKFNVGDEHVTGSWNLIYTGKILKITPTGVWFYDDVYRKNTRRRWEDFVHANWNFDAQSINEKNAVTSLSI